MLQQPLSCRTTPQGHPSRGKEGYLAGYLTVKSFWPRVAARKDWLQLADFYLLFLYDYFYEDAELTRLLLDGTRGAPESLAPITRHIRDRLLEPCDPAVIEEFSATMASTRTAAHATGQLLFPSHPFDVDPVARALALWQHVIGQSGLPPRLSAGSLASAHIRGATEALTYARDLLPVGSVTGDAEVGPHTTAVRLASGECISLPTDPGAPHGVFVAQAHLCVGIRTGRHVVYVIGGDKTLLALRITPAAPTPDEHTRIRRAALGRQAPEVCDVIVSAEASKLNGLRELTRVDGYLDQTTNLLDALYEPAALMLVPIETLEEAIIKMRGDGVYGLLDQRDDLISAIAIMRRGAGFAHNREALARELEAEGIDLSTVV